MGGRPMRYTAATVVFCDLASFSSVPGVKATILVQQLSAEVTHQLYSKIYSTESSPPVIFLPTGDGLAIVLEGDESDHWATVLSLVVRLINWAKSSPAGISIRIGIDHGDVTIMHDINRRLNAFGSTMNRCQRIMDAANDNQVLVSQSVKGKIGFEYSGPPFSSAAPCTLSGPCTISAKHDEQISVFVLNGGADWNVFPPCPRLIRGKDERTKFIAQWLETLQGCHNLHIYEQSALSTLSVIEQPRFGAITNNLLYRQREAMKALIEDETNHFTLLLHPFRRESEPATRTRYKLLAAWMKEVEALDRISYAVARESEIRPNQLIVASHFFIEGYKLDYNDGYDVSSVTYSKHDINTAINTFEAGYREITGKNAPPKTTKQAALKAFEDQLSDIQA